MWICIEYPCQFIAIGTAALTLSIPVTTNNLKRLCFVSYSNSTDIFKNTFQTNLSAVHIPQAEIRLAEDSGLRTCLRGMLVHTSREFEFQSSSKTFFIIIFFFYEPGS